MMKIIIMEILSVKLIIFLSISLNICFGAQRELSVLILSQTIWHSDSVPERIFLKSWFWEKSADDKSMKKYPACKELFFAAED